MRLLQAFRSDFGAFEAQAVTLDSLWSKAEQMGAVEVDHSISNRDCYRVRIQFERSSGSRIWAEGSDRNIHQALMMAIDEAQKLKG